MLELLEAAAAQLAIKVSYEALSASVGHGGLCRLKQQYRVIIDKRATVQERIATLASALASFDTSDIAMPAKAREVIRFHEGSARLKLPRLDRVTAAPPVAAARPGASPAASSAAQAPAQSDGVVVASIGSDSTIDNTGELSAPTATSITAAGAGSDRTHAA